MCTFQFYLLPKFFPAKCLYSATATSRISSWWCIVALACWWIPKIASSTSDGAAACVCVVDRRLENKPRNAWACCDELELAIRSSGIISPILSARVFGLFCLLAAKTRRVSAHYFEYANFSSFLRLCVIAFALNASYDEGTASLLRFRYLRNSSTAFTKRNLLW